MLLSLLAVSISEHPKCSRTATKIGRDREYTLSKFWPNISRDNQKARVKRFKDDKIEGCSFKVCDYFDGSTKCVLTMCKYANYRLM